VGVGVAAWVASEFGEHPGGEYWSQAGLETQDRGVRVPVKVGVQIALDSCDLRG
jgi:hypothetical protein